MALQPPKAPLLTIIGPSGAGKSQLAVDLALRFNGEVINSDAMQMYAGLPIITNKMPVAQRRGVVHHLLGFVDPLESTWTVDNYVTRAISVIEDIQQRGRLPILVGGTHYYTHSLLFRNSLLPANESKSEEQDSGSEGSEEFSILNGPTEALLEKLRQVDPAMANRWHPNDRRKIRRSLEIWLQTGRPASEVYSEQKQENGNELDTINTDGATRLRFPSLVLCVHAQREVLSMRIRSRVDQMVEEGLLREAIDLDIMFRAREAQGKKNIPRDEGMFVAIGYKELAKLLNTIHAGRQRPQTLQALEDEAIESIKSNTWRYIKSQVKWIRNRLLYTLREAIPDPPFVILDATKPSEWQEQVLEPAIHCTETFLSGESVKLSAQATPTASAEILPNDGLDQTPVTYKHNTCHVCGTTTVTEEDWHRHLSSVRHRRTKSRQRVADKLVALGANE